MVVLLTRSHGRVDRGGLVLGGFLLLCIVFVVFLPSIFEEMRRSGESPSRLGERRNGDGGSVADEVLLAMEKFNEMDAHFKEHFDRILFDLSSNRSSLDVLVLSFVHHEKKQKEIMLRHHITSRTETAKHHLFEKLTSNKTSSDRRLVHLLLKTLSSDRARDLEEFLIDFIDSPTSHSSADLEEKMEFYEEEVLKIRNLVAERTKEIDRLWSTQKKELTPGLTPKCQLDADNAGVLFGCYRDRFVRHRECDCEYTPERDQRLVLCVAVGCIAFGLALLQLSRRCDQGHRRGSKIPLVYPDFMLPKEGFGPKHLYHIPPSAIPILRPPPSIVVSSC
ncbi:hypothetical protein QR680_013402 [Steinernema hermaphroditum]|uniref:Uncharacterized protein n=1 Tax=Steinernema hermaphroditum TaxID=289476 RepID=A0AA39I812_9BILA|nr:hypothetical protein QR680_013402 [Steinernema hermaphroditum]